MSMEHQMMTGGGRPHWNILRVTVNLMYHKTTEANLIAGVKSKWTKTKGKKRKKEGKEKKNETEREKGKHKTLEQFLLLYLMFCLL